MKRHGFLIAFLAIASWAPAAELQTNSTASITVRTRTEFELSVDDPTRYGLTTSIPELSLNFGLTPWQKVGEKPHSAGPVGFLQFELDQMQIRYTNGGQPDYNAPKNANQFTFKFNDPNQAQPTGYFGPVYMPNMRSGIVWGDWTIQMAGAGVSWFWEPWNRTYELGYHQLAADWAYLDTRVQYRRADVPTFLAAAPATTGAPFNEGTYWSYQHPAKDMDDLSNDFTSSSGALVGVEYNTKLVSGRLKFTTQYPLSQLPAGQTNGLGFGTDVAFTPIKGLTSTSSVVAEYNYVGNASPDIVGAGTKLAFDYPLEAMNLKGMSLTPMVGYDVQKGISGSTVSSQEISGALTLHWPGTEGWGFDLLQDRTGTVFSGTTVAYKVYQPNLAASKITQTLLVTLYEDAGGEGIIKNLGSELVYENEFSDAGSSAKVSAYADWTFKTPKGNWIPWTRILWDSSPSALAAQVGFKADKVIPKTQIGLNYKSGDLIGGTSKNKLGTTSLYVDVTL